MWLIVCVCAPANPHTHEEELTTKTHNFKFPPRQLRAFALPRIPLIEDLTFEPLPPGLNLLVEFDPVSQWYNACYNIAVGWLKQGGGVSYTSYAQPSENVRTQLRKLGLNVDELEKNDYATLRIWDSYSVTLGQTSRERLHVESLKVNDQSISTLRDPTGMAGPPEPSRLRIADNYSVMARFNEEKSWVELTLTRAFPMVHTRKNTFICGIMKGVHSDWVYKQFESAADGVIDFKVEESGDEVRNLMRIRIMRNVGFDSRWHQLKIGDKFEVTLEK